MHVYIVDDELDNRQAQAGALGLTGKRTVGLVESVEYSFNLPVGHSYAIILN